MTEDNDSNVFEKELYTIHYDLLGFVINHRDQSYWTNLIISKQKTVDDYKSHILNSEDYITNIQGVFKSLFYSHIGYDTYRDYDLEEFTDYIKNFITENNQEVSSDLVKQYIINLTKFDDKYIPVIKEILNEECTEYKMKFLLRKFKEDCDLNISKLKNIIDDMRWSESEESVNSINENSEDPPLTFSLEINKSILSNFANEFNRQMYVEEYFFYVINSNSYNVDEYNKLKISINEIYKLYSDIRINEYEFSILYIDHKEKNNLNELENHIQTQLINSSGYEILMYNTIKSRYKVLYVADIEKEDLDYFFYKAKLSLLSVQDENLEKMIVAWKTQTDNQVYEIYQVYLRILERKPDVNEINDILQKYRYSNINVDEYMEKMIIDSIEFNDILKKIIANKFKDNTDVEILPSILYKMVKRIRDEFINSSTSFDEILTIIDKLVIQII